MRLESFRSREALYRAAASILVSHLDYTVSVKGRSLFASAGGTTPAPVLDRMAVSKAPWEKVTVTLTDERWVHSCSPDSNEGLIHRHLLWGEAKSAQFLPLRGDAANPKQAADVAERALANAPPLDAVLLGMGTDGHVASLFPKSPALSLGLQPKGPQRCIAVPPGTPAPDVWRISLTLRALLEAELIVLLVTGREKREVLEQRKERVRSPLPVDAILEQDHTAVFVLWAE